MAIIATKQAADTFRETLLSLFWRNKVDGAWYPSGVGNSLVRIKIDGGIYVIERRAETTSEWTQLVEAMVSDFDAETFRSWTKTFALTVH